MKKTTLVIGASLKPERYSYQAILLLTKNKHKVVAIGAKKGLINGVLIETQKLPFKEVDTVTLYLNPARQKEYYHYVINLQPKRFIFNPGTENVEFIALLKENGIKTEIACSLVLLKTGQY